MNEKITRTCESTFRTAEDNGEKFIEGHFAVYGDVYDMGCGITESIAPGAFDKYLGGDIRILCNHDSTLVLGRTKSGTAEVRSDDHGVFVRCKVNPDDVDAMNLYARMQRGDVSQASFGAYIRAEERKVNPDGSIHYTLTDIEAFEFSVCTFPAYEATEVNARSKENKALGMRRWKEKMRERVKTWH